MNVFQSPSNFGNKKVFEVQALYNTDSTLEFVLQPDKYNLLLADVFLNFSIQLDPNYIMDNQAAKLFDSVEVIVSGEKVSSRSNSNEYFLESFFKTKANHPKSHFGNMLLPAGWFTDNNFGTQFIMDEIANNSKKESRAVKRHTTNEVKDTDDNLTGRLYNFSMQIESPMFQQMKPLPSNVPVQINFKRANPELAVIKCTADQKKHYQTNSIDILNPYLEVTAYQSDELSKELSLERHERLYYPIEDGVIRTHTIEKGVNHVNFSATAGGKLPKMIFTSLALPEAFNGDEATSATLFTKAGMSKVELLVDNKILPGSVVPMDNNILAYAKFHRECKLLPNFYTGELMSLSAFESGNIMTAYSLSNIEQENGWLSIKIDFESPLAQSMVLIVYMIYDKMVTFEKDGSVCVH